MKVEMMDVYHLEDVGYEKKDEVIAYAQKHNLIIDWAKTKKHYLLYDIHGLKEEVVITDEYGELYTARKTRTQIGVYLKGIIRMFAYVRIRKIVLGDLIAFSEELGEEFGYVVPEKEVIGIYKKIEEGLGEFSNGR